MFAKLIWSCLFATLLIYSPLHSQILWEETYDNDLVDAVQRRIAGFLTTFPRYVTWPERVFKFHPHRLRFLFIGPNPIGEAGRTYVKTHGYVGFDYEVTHRQMVQIGVQDFRDYQIIYISGVENERVRRILNAVAYLPILTIGDSPNFISMGGIIQMHIVGKAVTFEVSNGNARRAKLQIDPRLAKYGKSM